VPDPRPGLPREPKRLSSNALVRFSERSTALWHFYRVAERLLELYASAHGTRRRTKGADWLLDRLEDVELGWGVRTGRADLRARFQLLFDLWTMRYVDYFNMFLAELFLEVAEKRPQVLASEERIEVSLLFESTSLDEVKGLIAARRAISLSFGGFRETLKFFRERLNVRPELDSNDLRRVHELIAIRNLIVHHDGVITDRFLLDTKWPVTRRGKRIVISEDLLDRQYESTERVASELASAAMKKFSI